MNFGDRVQFLMITGFGTGLAPAAPGTFGTLPAVAIGAGIQYLWFQQDHVGMGATLIGMAVLLFLIGCSTTGFVSRVFGGKDPQAFVLDEIVGYFVALGMFCFLKVPTPYAHLAAFCFFRLFDVTKPSPARELERWNGSLGIMADDVVAGLYAGLVLLGMHYMGIL